MQARFIKLSNKFLGAFALVVLTACLTITATVNGLMYNQYQGFMDYSAAVQAGTATQDAATLRQFMADAPEANMSATITSVKLRDMNSKAIVKGTPRM